MARATVGVMDSYTTTRDDTALTPLLRRASAGLALLPYLAAGLLMLFAWDTSRRFGAWPSYSSPDPKDANSFLYAASGFTMLVSGPAVMALAFGLSAVRRRRSLTRRELGLIVAGILGYVIVLGGVFASLGDWYMD